jgi:hypothetical protein
MASPGKRYESDDGGDDPPRSLAFLDPSPLNQQGDLMSDHDPTASEMIDARIKELGDWRGRVLGEVRRIIQDADPDIVEQWKWVKATNPGTPVWSHNGDICTGETYRSVVKLTFFKGAALQDSSGLFNSSLEGKTRRAIDIVEHEDIDADALGDLIREAVRRNSGAAKLRRTSSR